MANGPPPPTLPWTLAAGDQSAPPWNDEIAQIILGRRVIVNITYLEPDWKTEKSSAQFHGLITDVSREAGITVACEGIWAGHNMRLPPILANFAPAEPGIYQLGSTGEEIEDPDLTSSWSVAE